MEEILEKEPVKQAAPPKKVKLKLGKRRKRQLVLVAVLLLAGAILARNLGKGGSEITATYQKEAAQLRDITSALTGSGTLQPADAYTVTTLVTGEILSDAFEEGDVVTKDQLLYVIDSSDASTSKTQARKNYDKAVKNKYPSADISGTVSEVYVRNGDSVSAGTALCKITKDNLVSIDFQFSYVDSGDIYAGQTARVYIADFADTIFGTVQQVSQSGVANANGMVMTTARVTFENPGLVTEDCTAKAHIGNYSSTGWTALKVGTSSTITAAVVGKISGMNYLPGDAIRAGDRICTITGDNVDDQIDDAKTSLDNAQDRLEDYEVTSPIAGTVVEKYAKAGDNAGTGSNSALCIIYDLSYLEMTLNIDELDIRDIAVGQQVAITSDALEGERYQGVVTKVSIVGTTSGGTTTYPVTVRIDEYDGLLPGMNVDAEIVLASAENVLAIPNGAVNRGNTVLVTADSPSAVHALEQEAPEGYVYVRVETGESDDKYIEVTSGLQEGDTVAWMRTASGNMDMMMYGMMSAHGGMAGGGMPGGGERPSGGPGGSGGFPQ